MLATLLAIGLDHERSILFHQDHNLHHVELCWILNCLTRYLASLTVLSIVLAHPICYLFSLCAPRATYRMLLGRTKWGTWTVKN
ncbi:hypothetical protein EDD16DRAFT_1665135 [Pisolithus croceorrhizus]|nr:hypothetical protein EDD16DRAFT_1665135 [Pisolithus croceorrhizus]